MANAGNRVGQQLGNYRLIRLLGQGGFAEVYLGEHIQLGTQAALKVLHTIIGKDDVEQFRAEARTIARLVHPHIVRILDFNVESTVPFLVMNHAPNGTLRKLHPKGSRVPLDMVCSYVSQMASALHYAHQQKIIHRDIKPENMLLSKHHQVLLSDFGIALVAQSSHNQGEQNVAGTISYMAPEHIQGQARFTSDQYALGIVIYEWLCGSRPFHGSFTELCTQHLFAAPPSLCARNPALSPTVEQVVFTALAKDPKDRFGSIQAFATAFEQACQPRSIPSLVAIAALPTEPPLASTETLPLAQAGSSAGPLAPPNQAPTIPGPSQKGISRRTLFLGGITTLIGLGGVGAVWHSLVSAPTPTSVSMPTPTPTLTLAPPYTYRGQSGEVKAVAWSPNGKRIASTGTYDGTVQVWDAADGGHVYSYPGQPIGVNAVAWSHDGKRIASGSVDYAVQVWDAAGGGHVSIYRGHSAAVNAVAWSPDGRQIASASVDKTVQVWDAVDGKHIYTYRGHSKRLNAVAWSPDSTRIASAGDDTLVQVWDAVDGGHPYTYPGPSYFVNALAWSPDGKRIASGESFDGISRTVAVWNATDGGNVYSYHGHSGDVNAVAWSPNGTRIASGSSDTTVQVWQPM